MNANKIAYVSNGRDGYGLVWGERWADRFLYTSNQTSIFKATGQARTLKREIDELGKYVLNHGWADGAKGFEEATEIIFNWIEKNIEFENYLACSIKNGVQIILKNQTHQWKLPYEMMHQQWNNFSWIRNGII